MIHRTPSLAGAALHALIGVMATVYLVAAAVQIYRNDYQTAMIDLAITGLLGVILELRKKRYGRPFSNYKLRTRVKSMKQAESCDWCGESIEAEARAVAYRGAHNGRQFNLNHHPECDVALRAWYEENLPIEQGQGTGSALPRPSQRKMQRGQPHERRN